MENSSLGAAICAVFAVSGGVVLLASKVHKHLLSDFMKKIEIEIRLEKDQQKKKVRFSNEVIKLGPQLLEKVEEIDDHNPKRRNNPKNFESMPLNWQALYKGILQHKSLKHYN
ncbi:uncharacterized protein LOC125837538 [Solanum verrucosum]|uniref:Putative ovule protein n=1 Tax=Solanum chacoense TaxID=4108 RepID=A0A0V0HJR5_SOLCH|nr:uncharacterized protein LOC125837538 [Solanum verrucosum]XP_049384497.1 uncharacterized protein LOC125848630 [Solanum stenotomum]